MLAFLYNRALKQTKIGKKITNDWPIVHDLIALIVIVVEVVVSHDNCDFIIESKQCFFDGSFDRSREKILGRRENHDQQNCFSLLRAATATLQWSTCARASFLLPVVRSLYLS